MILKNFNNQSGNEIFIHSISGGTKSDESAHYTRVVNESSDLTISGKYVSLTLTRLLVNIPLQSDWTGKVRAFTVLGATWHNKWNYRLNSISTDSVKMIDSEGFQHGDLCEYHEYCKIVLPNTQEVIDMEFAWPELTLEAHAKTKGWVWFESLAAGVAPHRFIFKFDVFEPGYTSGRVEDSESFEFVLASYSQGLIKELE